VKILSDRKRTFLFAVCPSESESIPCCECRACRVIPFYPSTHPIPYPSPSLHSRKTLPDRAPSRFTDRYSGYVRNTPRLRFRSNLADTIAGHPSINKPKRSRWGKGVPELEKLLLAGKRLLAGLDPSQQLGAINTQLSQPSSYFTHPTTMALRQCTFVVVVFSSNVVIHFFIFVLLRKDPIRHPKPQITSNPK